jgi:hypothetical protein
MMGKGYTKKMQRREADATRAIVPQSIVVPSEARDLQFVSLSSPWCKCEIPNQRLKAD